MTSRRHPLVEGARRHWLFLTALALGVALRAVVTLAYTPALLFPDSRGYLGRALPFQVKDTRPSGYSLFLLPFRLVGQGLSTIEIVQHLMGLALAVLCYAFLVRRGVPRWGATLAVLPLLLDPLQLVLEAYILSDVLFETLIVGACLLLLWRRRPGAGALVLAGVLVGCSVFVRGAGSFLVVVFLVALVCLRVRWTRIVGFLVAAILPVAAYAVDYHHTYGQYAVTTAGPRFLYARLAPTVDCHNPRLHLRSYEKVLCPKKPIGQRHSPDWFMWGHKRAPQWHVQGPPGMTQTQVLKDYDKRVVRAEPLMLVRVSMADAARGFAPVRTHDVPGHPASYWLFAGHYWSPDLFIKRGVLSPTIREGTGYRPHLARFLTGYQKWVYAPGPLMAVLLLVAVAGILGLGRARRSGHRVAIGLLTATCVLPLLTAAALSGFAWRYQLPQIPLLPVAGALALSALLRGRGPGQPEPGPPVRFLERATDRRSLQVAIAVVTGAVVAVLSGLLAVASGWFAPGSAAVIGAALGVLTLVMLLVARAHSRSDLPTSAHP
ncbi:MAG: phospholipid carrier-dependent glycosyltransferase [Nocardioidaceae bacterium]